MSYILGIDLGTTNSCAAIIKNGSPLVIPNFEGDRTTPSVIAFTGDHEQLVGGGAKNQSITNPDGTIISVKRKMGTDTKFNVDGRIMSPQEVSAMILKKIKKDSEEFLGEEIKDAVITVPAYFSDSQRQATKDAGEIAGLNVLRIINEPTAAALAYGLEHEDDQKILVFDLGGGTFDVSVVSIGDGVIEVLATSGNNKLGGDDFDKRIAEWIAGEFYKRHKVDIKKDKNAMQRISEAAEEAKKTLTHQNSAKINLPFIAIVDNSPQHIDLTLSKNKFNQLIEPLIKKTEEPIEIALKDAGLKHDDIDKVLLVGGSTRVPAIQENIKRILNKDPLKTLNPDECVAIGAAVQGDMLKDNSEFVLVLVDVTPLTLSLETSNGVSSNVIKRNTKIPCTVKKVYTTAVDNQDNILIKIVQGERLYAKDNIKLGEVKLDGILPAPQGVPQIEVTFAIDVNGILEVSAKDLTTKRENHVTINNTNKLSKEEIDLAISNALKYEEEDRLHKQISEAQNACCDLIDKINMTLSNQDIEISDKDRGMLRSKIDNILDHVLSQKVFSEDGLSVIEEKTKDLEATYINIFNPQSKKE